MKALHSMWKHKAKGNRVYSSDRQVKDCFFKYRLISDSLKNPVMRLCSSRKTKPSQANYMPGAHMGCLLSGTVSSIHNNKNDACNFTHRIWSWIPVKMQRVKCLCRCSSLFSCSDHTSTFLWHTGRKGKPIIISAANNGFENYLEVRCKNRAKLKSVCVKCTAFKYVQIHINDMTDGSFTHSDYSN